MAQLKIKLAKSLSGRKKNHIATAYSLGLRKIGPVHSSAGQRRHQRQDRNHFPPCRGGERVNVRRCR